MNIFDDFNSTYTFKIITETNGNEGERFYYPSASTQGGRDGIMILVKPQDSKSWLGTFAFDDMFNEERDYYGVYTTPSSDNFCVVTGASGYWVSSKNPHECKRIEAYPIVDVHVLKEKQLILFSDFTTICAYGVNGFKWRTKRICPDGFIITSIDDEFIVGKYTDWDQYTKMFGVNLNSGEIE